VEPDKKQILNRLATIAGHLRGIQKQIEQERCCRDILSQTYAVERALKAFEVALVDRYLVSRLPTDDPEERSSEMLHELFDFAALDETSPASEAWAADSQRSRGGHRNCRQPHRLGDEGQLNPERNCHANCSDD